jgi:undecaprenyl-diphosphatase
MLNLGFEQINGLAGKYMWLDALCIFFAQYFEYVLIFCIILFLFLPARFSWLKLIEKARENYIIFLQAILAVLVSRLVLTEIIRYVLPISRPFVDNDVNLLFNYPGISSFPSGHAAFYFALSAVIFYYYKKAGIAAFVTSFLICIARVFCGIHWPLDIVAGFVVGVFTSWLLIALGPKLRKRRIERAKKQ